MLRDNSAIAAGALLMLPAGLTVFLAFDSGGFYPGGPAYAAILLCVVLLLRLAVATNPFEGIGRALGLVLAAVGGYALLALLSQIWSHAPGRSLVEFDLALVYGLVMLVAGVVAHTPQRLRLILRSLAIAIVSICTIALVTRLLPHVWPTTNGMGNARLSFPLTYWNALGVLGAFGVVLCLHLSSDSQEPVAIRAGAAAAIPVMATTIYFTFSRGGITMTFVGVAAYVLIARPRGVISAGLAAAPAAGVAIRSAYGASLLATPKPVAAGAVVQGRQVALTVLGCALAAAAVRVLLARILDPRLDRVCLSDTTAFRLRRLVWAGLAVSVLLAVVALRGTIAREYHGFMSEARPGSASDLRARLADPANNGRIDLWRVAWHDFERAPLLGHGAGTFENSWAKNRPVPAFVVDAHSLYLETLDELGITGFVLLVGAIGGLLVGAARRIRGRDRSLYAATFVVMLIWALHAGIDWDWEMPVITVPFFALGGFMLARPPAASRTPTPTPTPARSARSRRTIFVRAAAAVGCVVVAVPAAYVWFSQRQLDQATAAFARHDCATATESALSSISILGRRPEPYEVVAYCDVRGGRRGAALGAIETAISLDPDNWNFRYDLAVVRASSGLDPRPAIAQALELNPREPLVLQARRWFDHEGRIGWKRDGTAIADAFTSL